MNRRLSDAVAHSSEYLSISSRVLSSRVRSARSGRLAVPLIPNVEKYGHNRNDSPDSRSRWARLRYTQKPHGRWAPGSRKRSHYGRIGMTEFLVGDKVRVELPRGYSKRGVLGISVLYSTSPEARFEGAVGTVTKINPSGPYSVHQYLVDFRPFDNSRLGIP